MPDTGSLSLPIAPTVKQLTKRASSKLQPLPGLPRQLPLITALLSLPSASVADANFGTTPSCDFTLNASISITANWVIDTNSDNTTPTSVWFIENATASWTGNGTKYSVYSGGNAANGLSDPYVALPATGPVTSGSSATSTAVTVPPDDWHQYPVTAVTGNATITGTVALPKHTMMATASGTGKPIGVSGTVALSGSLSYSISVHAQPYNYYRIPGQSVKGQNADGSPNGEIDWTYGYSSTDGNTNDLTTCYWHEYVTYPGMVGAIAQPNKYYPQNPPFNYSAPAQFINNPTVFPGAGTNGNLMKAVYDPDPIKDKAEEFDITKVPAFVDPSLYTYGTYTATQLFQFDDTATGETNVTVPGAGSGPYSIVRTVQILDPNDYQYSATKDTVTNTKLGSVLV
jgi:hypothetical protein